MLSHPAVLLIAGAIYTLNFFADKIPWVDTLWDSIHVFVRPLGAAALAVAATADTDPVFKAVIILACGAVALGSHSAKAGTRLVANQSPEPFSNIALSFVDDAVAFAGAWLAITHPLITLVLVIAAMAILVWFLPRLFRLVRFSVLALRGWVLRLVSSEHRPSRPPLEWSRHRPSVEPGKEPLTIRCASGKGLPLGRWRVGYICVGDDVLRFMARVRWRLRVHDLSLPHVKDVEVRKRLLSDTLIVRLDDREV